MLPVPATKIEPRAKSHPNYITLPMSDVPKELFESFRANGLARGDINHIINEELLKRAKIYRHVCRLLERSDGKRAIVAESITIFDRRFILGSPVATIKNPSKSQTYAARNTQLAEVLASPDPSIRAFLNTPDAKFVAIASDGDFGEEQIFAAFGFKAGPWSPSDGAALVLLAGGQPARFVHRTSTTPVALAGTPSLYGWIADLWTKFPKLPGLNGSYESARIKLKFGDDELKG